MARGQRPLRPKPLHRQARLSLPRGLPQHPAEQGECRETLPSLLFLPLSRLPTLLPFRECGCPLPLRSSPSLPFGLVLQAVSSHGVPPQDHSLLLPSFALPSSSLTPLLPQGPGSSFKPSPHPMESYIKITATVPKPDGSGDMLTKVGKREEGAEGGRREG